MLRGVFHAAGNVRNCSFINIDPNTGEQSVVASNLNMCTELTTSYPSFSAVDVLSETMAILVAGAPALYGIDFNTGEESVIAPLPAYNTSDAFVGLAALGPFSNELYVLTQSSVYQVVGQGGLRQVASGLSLPGSAQTSVDAKRRLVYVADSESANLYVLDARRGWNVTVVPTGIGKKGPWDAAWDPVGEQLIELTSYELFGTNVTTGATTQLVKIPDGPGYPRVYGLGLGSSAAPPTSSVFWFMDFSNVYTIDLQTLAVSAPHPCPGAPQMVGFPQWLLYQ